MAYNFRFNYIQDQERQILSEIQQMGIHNFIETVMSLKSLDIKKNLEVVTREYQVNNYFRRVSEFLIGSLIDYFIIGQGDINKLVQQVNLGMAKILNVKDFRVWVRDVMNNYLWTYNNESMHETFDLVLDPKGIEIASLKDAAMLEFPKENQKSLVIPMINQNTEINLGLV